MKTLEKKTGLLSIFDILILTTLLGVLWGLSETLLGNVIRLNAVSIRAGLLTGIGFAVMGFFGGLIKKPVLYPIIALITAASIQLSVPILHCSILCKANSSLAIVLHGSILSVITITADRRGRGSIPAYAIVGFFSAGLSAVLFYPAGIHLAPCNYLQSFSGNGGFINFMLKEGLLWAAFSGLGYPLGILLGRNSEELLLKWKNSAPVSWYTTLTTATGAGIIMIAATIILWS